MDLDELFSDTGAELSEDVIVKAQLRFRVQPPQHPVAQDLVDRRVVGYDEHVEMMCDEIEDVLRHDDAQPQVALVVHGDVAKAIQQPFNPGAHGGKWYRDGQGHIRYGEKPVGQYQGPLAAGGAAPELQHLRPQPFRGMTNVDGDLTGYLTQNGGRYGFTPNELRFLNAWYGMGDDSGALFDAFLAQAQLSRADLSDDITQLRFGPNKLTYEEAVFEFFAAQESLFMGDKPNGGENADDWETILNEQIRPLIDSAFSKYEELKEDESFKQNYSNDADNQRRRFFSNAKKCEKETKDLASRVVGEWDPKRQVTDVVRGMRALGLFSGSNDRHARLKGKPHLKGAIALDDRLLVEDPKSNPLLASGDKLGKLTASQLMLLYAAAELHRRWDPDTRSYSTERQKEIGSGPLGEAAVDAIAAKSKQWATAINLAREHLDTLVDRLVIVMNKANDVDAQPKAKKASRGESE